MRYLIISDIHAHLEAFEAVLADAKELYDKVWCLGDLVSIGPYPNECINLLLTLEHSCVAGDDDWLVLGKFELDEDYNKNFRESILQTRGQLSQRTQDYLEKLPERIITNDHTLVHGSPRHPLWEYINYPVIAEKNFDYFNTRYCFVGHMQAPVIFQETKDLDNPVDVFVPGQNVNFDVPIDIGRGKYIINPGGVGGGLKAINFDTSFYALWDEEDKCLEFKRIPLAFNPFVALRKSNDYSGQRTIATVEEFPQEQTKSISRIQAEEYLAFFTQLVSLQTKLMSSFETSINIEPLSPKIAKLIAGEDTPLLNALLKVIQSGRTISDILKEWPETLPSLTAVAPVRLWMRPPAGVMEFEGQYWYFGMHGTNELSLQKLPSELEMDVIESIRAEGINGFYNIPKDTWEPEERPHIDVTYLPGGRTDGVRPWTAYLYAESIEGKFSGFEEKDHSVYLKELVEKGLLEEEFGHYFLTKRSSNQRPA